MFRYIPRRGLASLHKPSAAEIRQEFIDYFVKDNDHHFIKSSSVIPYGDPSVAFVNAGMNQFKSVLLGVKPPPVPRAANSQKCIRVGGKHNDLEAVGRDGSHHTFFEMLGNWSFGDYFKKEACVMAWQLLIGPLRLDPSHLVVTYFGGDEREGLSADEECADVWRTLGVTDSQLIPCGMKDNFWEMGPEGPCGPCTEIHVRYEGGMLELWNLVFVQYERRSDRSLVTLPRKHVDTGMGLERMAKVLQGVNTNYDTDLFSPLFELIHKSSGSPRYAGQFGAGSDLDCAYRVLADHSRAVAIALADGMFPDQNHKLRRLLRRCLLISEQDFRQPGPGLTSDLISLNAEILGNTYPELHTSLARSLHLVARESETYVQSRSAAKSEWGRAVKNRPELATLPANQPGMIAALAELKGKKEITGEIAFKLYDTYGLESCTIEQLAKCLKLPLDLLGMQKCIESQQSSSRVVICSAERTLISLNIPPTNDDLKYEYSSVNGEYNFPQDTKCEILGILVGESQVIDKVNSGMSCNIVLDKTCMYSESGGQISDKGEIITDSGKGRIENVQKLGQYIVHHVTVMEGELKTKDTAKLKLDSKLRLGAMQHHSATHLLNSALHQLLPATYQRSSHVTSEYLTFDFAIYNKEKLESDDIIFLDNYINKYIKLKLPINRKLISISELPSETVLIPGENYPDDVYVLNILDGNNLISVEPCCGTHCLNTSDIIDFCIVAEKSSGTGVRSIRALAGNFASLTKQEARRLHQELNQLEDLCNKWQVEESTNFEEKLQEFKHDFTKKDLPLVDKQILSTKFEVLEKKLLERQRREAKADLEREMTSLLAACPSPYVIHVLRGSGPEPLPLARANAMCLPLRASLVFAVDGEEIRARCAVPQSLVTEQLTAERWVNSVLTVLRASGSAPKGQDPKLVFNMKPKRVTKVKQEEVLITAITEAKKFLKTLGLE